MYAVSIIQESIVNICQRLSSKFVVSLLKSLARRVGVALVSGTAVFLGHVYCGDVRSGGGAGQNDGREDGLKQWATA